MKDIKKKLSRVDVFPELAPYFLVLKIIEINDLLLVSKIPIVFSARSAASCYIHVSVISIFSSFI